MLCWWLQIIACFVYLWCAGLVGFCFLRHWLIKLLFTQQWHWKFRFWGVFGEFWWHFDASISGGNYQSLSQMGWKDSWPFTLTDLFNLCFLFLLMQYFVSCFLTFSIIDALWFSPLVGLLWVLCWEPVNQNKSFIFTLSHEVFQAFGTKIIFLVWLLLLFLIALMVCTDLLWFWRCFCVQLVLPDVNWSVYSSQDRLIPPSPQLNTWSSALFTD